MGAFFELLAILVIFWLVVSFHWTRLLFWVLFLTAFPVAIVGAALFLASRAIESERVVVLSSRCPSPWPLWQFGS